MGQITASISVLGETSSITIDRPFLNATPALFSSWKDFFVRAAGESTNLLARPMINVESHYIDAATLCSILPLEIDDFSVPSTPDVPASFNPGTTGNLDCSAPFVKLDF